MSFEVPEHVRPIRDAVYDFVTEEVEPIEGCCTRATRRRGLS